MPTLRQDMTALLEADAMTTRDLSQVLKIKEKDVYDHLRHIQRTLKAKDKRLVIEPARCRACGFVFQERRRFTRPGKCPQCRQTYIDPPAFRVVPL